VIVGVDQMAFFASYLRHTLSLLDIRAEIVASTGGESLQRLGRIGEDTLVITLSAGRAHPLLLRAMKLALHRGARTLAISDATMSEVGEHAELTLYFSSNSPSFARSNTALMALVQALAYGLYARDEATHKDRIRAYKLK
jgi:DNA-binding MurR/RpiR family transcriptional regulator